MKTSDIDPFRLGYQHSNGGHGTQPLRHPALRGRDRRRGAARRARPLDPHARRDDQAGRRWSKEHRYAGYTSYASLNDLPRRDPAFADLAKLLGRHAATFATRMRFELEHESRGSTACGSTC